MRVFPRKIDFLEVFDKASQNVIDGLGCLVELLEHMDDIENRVKCIHDFEQENDTITHETVRRLNQTFLTPIDREDIYALATNLDDIIDLAWAAADRIKLFNVTKAMEGSQELASCLQKNARTVHQAIVALHNKKYAAVQELCIEINRLENEADAIFKQAIGRMFNNEHDPVTIIKWKEILENMEHASDKCEDVANILESVVLKNA